MRQNLLYKSEIMLRRGMPSWIFDWRCQAIGICPVLAIQPDRISDVQIRGSKFDAIDVHLLSTQIPPVILQQRIQAGHEAVLAVQRETLVGVVWFAYDEYFDLDTRCSVKLNSTEAWLYGAWVRRENRGRGVYASMLQEASRGLKERGIQTLLFGVDWTNRVSLRAHQSFGARWIGQLSGIRVCGLGGYRLTIPPDRSIH